MSPRREQQQRHDACFRKEGQQRYAGANASDSEGTLSQGGVEGAYGDGANLRAIVPAAANLRAIVRLQVGPFLSDE
jgi:hypothetical protein